MGERIKYNILYYIICLYGLWSTFYIVYNPFIYSVAGHAKCWKRIYPVESGDWWFGVTCVARALFKLLLSQSLSKRRRLIPPFSSDVPYSLPSIHIPPLKKNNPEDNINGPAPLARDFPVHSTSVTDLRLDCLSGSEFVAWSLVDEGSFFFFCFFCCWWCLLGSLFVSYCCWCCRILRRFLSSVTDVSLVF